MGLGRRHVPETPPPHKRSCPELFGISQNQMVHRNIKTALELVRRYWRKLLLLGDPGALSDLLEEGPYRAGETIHSLIFPVEVLQACYIRLPYEGQGIFRYLKVAMKDGPFILLTTIKQGLATSRRAPGCWWCQARHHRRRAQLIWRRA